MYRQSIIFVFILLTFTKAFAQDGKKKTCIHNLNINGTNLNALYRKQVLVVGVTDLNHPASRTLANRLSELHRELERENIRDSTVRFVLVNEIQGASAQPGKYVGKLRVFQDNTQDRVVKKLRNQRESSNNFIFGRCGYLIYSQDDQNTNLDDRNNYDDLLRNIRNVLKNRRRCERLCS